MRIHIPLLNSGYSRSLSRIGFSLTSCGLLLLLSLDPVRADQVKFAGSRLSERVPDVFDTGVRNDAFRDYGAGGGRFEELPDPADTENFDSPPLQPQADARTYRRVDRQPPLDVFSGSEMSLDRPRPLSWPRTLHYREAAPQQEMVPGLRPYQVPAGTPVSLPREGESSAALSAAIARRYQDSDVIRFIARLQPSEGLKMYGEVIQLIQTRHLQPPALAALVSQGIEELLTAIEVPEFQSANRLSLQPQQVQQFRIAVRQAMRQTRISRTEDVQAVAQWIMQQGQQSLGIPASTTITEMTYGAVSALDRFSAFVTPEADRLMNRQLGLSAGPATTAGRSVTSAAIISASEGIGYVKLQSFGQTAAAEVQQAVLRLHQQGLQALVLDLRGDPGGLLTAAIQVANEFLPSGTIVSTRGRTAEDNTTEHATGRKAFKVPLVVLIDENSASASEILAAAIQENGRGVLVGRRSYGKGTVQTLFPLQGSGAGLRLTTARFFSPKGREIAGTGVSPDVPVAADSSHATDAALATALHIATQQVGVATRQPVSSGRSRAPVPRAASYPW